MMDELKKRLVLTVGKLIGQSKRKDKDIVDAWLQLCNGLGVKPTDRLLELMAFDLQHSGVDLSQVKVMMKQKEVQKVADKYDTITTIQKIFDQFMDSVIAQRTTQTAQIMDLQNQLQQLNQVLIQLQAENTALREIINKTEEMKQLKQQLDKRLQQTPTPPPTKITPPTRPRKRPYKKR